jgi:hypothetical protein
MKKKAPGGRHHAPGRYRAAGVSPGSKFFLFRTQPPLLPEI